MSIEFTMPVSPRRIIKLSNLIGWQGITVVVPDDWNLGVISGDRASGYVRVDDANMPRLEVKWSKPSGAVELKRILDNYIKELQKKSKKSDAPIEAQTDVRLVSRRQKRKAEIIGYTWKAQQVVWGTIWKCGSCGRVVIAQVLGRADENVRAIAERVIGSLEDHAPDGWDPWGAYGFQFEIPDDFALEKHRLVTGHLEFKFTRGKQKEEFITVSRWGMGDVLLKDGGLDSWLDRTFPARYKGLTFERKQASIKSHTGAFVRGRLTALPQKIRQDVKRLIGRTRRYELMAHVWHCADSNKIFSVECNVTQEDAYLLEDVTDSVVCHEE